ncbi:MAG: hypothetical protein IKN01_06210 [Prevotella sp.]|nr:hypothetical protein [Prevotella sp.]
MKKLFTLKSSSTTNRILITLLLCVTVGAPNLWAQSHVIFQQRSYRVDANATSATVYFSDFHGNASNATSNFHCTGLGNISVNGNLSIEGRQNGSVTVNFSKKTGSSKGGAVVIWFDSNWGKDRDFCVINVPSTCDNEDLVWDLKTVTGPTANNMHPWYQNLTEGNFATAINSEWVTKFKVRQVDRDPHYYNGPAFAAKEVVKGNNAYYIPETAGLLIDTQDRKESFGVSCGKPESITDQVFYESTSPVDYVNSCTYSFPSFGNDNDPRGTAGSGKVKLTIPNLKKDWYVKLYWARHADNAGHLFTASNVTDLNGKYINSSFSITGSWLHDNEYVGPTTFIVNDNGDVSFELQTNNGWTDLYKIVVSENYSTDMKIVEVESIDEANSNTPQGSRSDWAINTETDHVTLIGDETKTKIYSGISGEVLCHNAVSPDFRTEKEGNVTYTADPVKWTREGKTSYNLLKLKVTGGYGNIKIIQEMKRDGYVLDKKEQWIAVGHVTPQTYPYTWEFTSYNMNDKFCAGTYINMVNTMWKNYKWYGYYDLDQPGYDGTYRMHTYITEDGSLEKNLLKPLFAQGSQYAYATESKVPQDVPEYAGLGMTLEGIGPKGNNDAYFGYNKGCGHGWLWGIKELLIPAVDDGMTVYIQTERGSNPTFEIEGGTMKDNDYDPAAAGENILVEKKYDQGSDSYVDDKINTYVYGFTVKANVGGNKTNVRVKNLDPTKRIFRIGVTDIRKDINKFGYATESRDRDIDHMMTGFLTIADAHAYFAESFTTNPDMETGQDPIGFVKLVKAVKTETGIDIDRGSTFGSGKTIDLDYECIPAGTGVVLYSEKVKNAGKETSTNIPLFVRAMHVVSTSTSDNLLVGPVTSKYIDGKGKDYILTNIYQHRQNLNVNLEGSGTEEKIGFYRAQPGNLGANKAYLNLDNVTSSPAKLVLFSFFDDEEEDIHNGITTGIEDATHLMDNGQWTTDNAEWYNLNGQKLNGKPTAGGLYIVNGKKVLVK